MTMTKFITVTVLGFALTLSACQDQGDNKKGADKQAQKQGKEADKGDKKPDDIKQPDPQPEPEPQGPSLDPKVAQAVTLANDIAANPGDADAILEKAGLDRESFEKLLYEIAKDPDLSKSYAVAREA
jgi:hypothetical protein